MRKYTFTLACCMAVPAMPTQAAEIAALEPVVVTATRSEHNLSKAPASVTVITAEQIKASGASNLLEAVRAAPGITLNGRQVGGRKTLSIRGAEDRHTLVLINGKRISSTDDTIGHSDYQYGWLALDQIERIEIVRGPMSALYGSEAMGGVINIITRQAQQQWHGSLRARADVQAGSGGNGHLVSAQAGGPLGEMFDLQAGAEQLRSSSTPRKEDRRISDIEGHKRESGNMQLGFTPITGQRLQLDLLHTDEDLDRDQDSRGAAPYYLDTYTLERRQQSLSWQAEWSNLSSELRYNKTTFDVTNKRTNGVAPTRDQRLEDKVWDGNLGFLLGARNNLTLGAEHRTEYLENAGLRGGSDDAVHKALYLQDEISLAENLTMTLGARLDRHEIFGNETSPRAYLVWSATPALTIKGGYGEAFRAPTLKQISPSYEGAEGPHTFYGNADVKPETSKSWELSADWRNVTSAYTATVFRNEIKDLIYTDLMYKIGPRGFYQYDNISRARIHGLELSMTQQLSAGFSLLGNLTWLDARDTDTRDHLTGRPELVFTPALQWQGERLSGQLEWQYTGRQWLKNNDARLERVTGYSLVNLNAAYQAHDNLKLRAGVNNLRNLRLEDKSELFGYVETPRTVWLGVEANF